MKTMRVGRKIALGFGILLLLMLAGMFASNLGFTEWCGTPARS
jgi:CHASE3 domain sensor protein